MLSDAVAAGVHRFLPSGRRLAKNSSGRHHRPIARAEINERVTGTGAVGAVVLVVAVAVAVAVASWPAARQLTGRNCRQPTLAHRAPRGPGRRLLAPARLVLPPGQQPLRPDRLVLVPDRQLPAPGRQLFVPRYAPQHLLPPGPHARIARRPLCRRRPGPVPQRPVPRSRAWQRYTARRSWPCAGGCQPCAPSRESRSSLPDGTARVCPPGVVTRLRDARESWTLVLVATVRRGPVGCSEAGRPCAAATTHDTSRPARPPVAHKTRPVRAPVAIF
jgi:hypothetical protein